MQGTASDIIKLAMLAMEKGCAELDYQMLIQVHDELVFEVKQDQVDAFTQKIKDLMQEVFTLNVPLIVNVSYGDNWEEAH